MLAGKALSLQHTYPYLDRMYNSFPGFDYYRFAYLLAQYLQPDIIVELGTQYARCTAHFAAGAPEARVVTIDCDDVWRQELFEYDVQMYCPNVEIVRGNSTFPVTAARFEDETIGICFADSLHTEDHVLREIEVWTPKMVQGGVWLIDDFKLMPNLLEMLPFEVKGIIKGLHTNPVQWPDQEFGYAIVD